MTYQQSNQGGNYQSRPPREPIDVSAMGLKCAKCQTPITQLPFQPDPNRPVFCRDCNRERTAKFSDRRN